VPTFELIWKQVAELLENAAAALPEAAMKLDRTPPKVGSLKGTLGEFQEFLQHNELELAWEALAAVAKRIKAGAGVWLLLARAATLMESKAQIKFATAQLIKAIKREEPRYRLVYERAYRNREGKIVWKPPRLSKGQGLTPA